MPTTQSTETAVLTLSSEESSTPTQERRAYERPQLTHYGRFTQVTLADTGTDPGGGTGGGCDIGQTDC